MTLDEKHRSKMLRSLWLWVGYWVALFAATHVPIPARGVIPVRHGDKIIHFALYFLLTRLGGRYLHATGRRVSVVLLITWGVIYAAYAGLDEWLQQFVGRTMNLSDWLFDAAGIAAATVTLAAGRRLGALSEQSRTDR